MPAPRALSLGPFSLAAVALAALALAALTLGACGSGTTLDGGRLEGLIRKRLTQVGVAVVSVSCPAHRKIVKGDVFQCRAKAKSPSKGEANVTIRAEQVDTSGNVRWDVSSGLLDLTKVKEDVMSKFARLNISVNVDCHTPAKFV